MGVVSLYKRVGMVYEMWICNGSFWGELPRWRVVERDDSVRWCSKFVMFFRHDLSVLSSVGFSQKK